MTEEIIELSTILARKELDLNLFSKGEIKVEDHIAKHIGWAFENIYSKPYSGEHPHEGLARSIHGIQHVTRVLIYVVVFANLFRRHGDIEALGLTDLDIKLIQIAALFHDSAREDEGEDQWDYESGLFLYQYLTCVLNVDPEKAKKLAEAAANKDSGEDDYYELIKINEECFIWKKSEKENPKNIYQKLIHDADSLDIMRVVPFEATYLDFYKEIVKYGLEDFNKEAFYEMAILIIETKGILETQGDSRIKINIFIKKNYEHIEAYKSIVENILENVHCKLFPVLHANNKLLIGSDLQKKLLPNYNLAREEKTLITESFTPIHEDKLSSQDKTLTTESLSKAMLDGRLLARGICAPSLTTTELELGQVTAVERFLSLFDSIERPDAHLSDGNFIDIEIHEMLKEDGNKNRSTTLSCYGASLYLPQGFFIMNPKMENVRSLSKVDQHTGYGKEKKSSSSHPIKDVEETKKHWQEIIENQMHGGSSIDILGYEATHNEIIYDIEDVQAIYFTNDPTIFNEMLHHDQYPLHSCTPYLQALFMQKSYQKRTGIKLPIVEYSGIYHFIEISPDYTDEQILKMWVSAVSEVFNKKLAKNKPKRGKSIRKNLDILKLKAIYGRDIAKLRKNPIFDYSYLENLTMDALREEWNNVEDSIESFYLKNSKISPDSNYSSELKTKITQALTDEREALLEKHRWQKRIEKFKKEIARFSQEKNEDGIKKAELFLNINMKTSIDNFPEFFYGGPIYDFFNTRLNEFDDGIDGSRLFYFFKKDFSNFSTKNLIKIYFLALKLKNNEWVSQAEEQAEKIIVESFEKIDQFMKTSLLTRGDFYHDTLEKILEYSLLFNLLDRHREKIKEQLNQYFYDLSMKINKSTIENFKKTLHVISLSGFLNREIIGKYRIILKKLKENCSGYRMSHEDILKCWWPAASEVECYGFRFPEFYRLSDEHHKDGKFFTSNTSPPYSFRDVRNYFDDLSDRLCYQDEDGHDLSETFNELEAYLDNPPKETLRLLLTTLKEDLFTKKELVDSSPLKTTALEVVPTAETKSVYSSNSFEKFQPGLFSSPEFKRQLEQKVKERASTIVQMHFG